MPDPKLDGIEELERQQAAETFEIPDRGPPGFDLFGDDAMLPSARRSGSGEERPREARTLEDLYVIYPELGRGDWKLRVERLAPRHFRGRSTSGYLGDFYERMSMDDFSERFGGGQYKLAVMRPVGAGDTVSKSDYKHVKELRIVVPGDPSLSGITSGGGEDEMNAMNPSMMLLGRPSEAVEIERIRAEQREKDRDRQEKNRLSERLDVERQRSMEAPRETIALMSSHTQRAFDDLKEHSNQQLVFWQGEVERLRGELNIRDSELREARLALTRAEAEAGNTNRSIETAAMREMKERHDERYGELKERAEEERRRMQEEHARKIDEMQRDHRRQVEELTGRHAEERRTYESSQALERERVREEARQRIEAIEKSRADEVRVLRDTYEGRLKDMRDLTDREVAGARENARREVESIRQSEQSSTALTKETAAVRTDLLQAEMTRLRHEAAELRAEVGRKEDEIRRLVQAQNKPLAEALAEARQTASLVGMVDASDVPSGDGPWYKDAIAIGQRLVESAPEIFREVSKVREANRQAAAQQRPPQQQQHMVLQQQQRPPQQRYAPPAPQIIAPPAESSYTPPPLGGAATPRGAPVPIGPVVHQVASPLQPGGDRTASPLAASDEGEGSPAGEVDNAPAPTVPMQQQQAGPARGPAPAVIAGMTEEGVGRFFKMLEDSVRDRNVVSPEMFAQGFVAEVGRDNAVQLVQQFTPEVIIDIARRHTNGQSRIVTRDGQRYVREMIGHVQRLAVASAAVA